MAKPAKIDWASQDAENAQDASQVNPGTKPAASPPRPPHDNPDAVEHAMIGEAGPAKQEGGRDQSVPFAPTVSLHPTSQPQGDADTEDKPEYRVVDKASFRLNSTTVPERMWQEGDYPFNELEIGQGMFCPVEKGGSTDRLMAKLHKQVNEYRKQNSEVEKDENGDDVMEDVAINVKQRNEDGTVMLDGDMPRLGIKSGFRPKLIGPNFAVKAVVKGDKIGENNEADADGALVIRCG